MQSSGPARPNDIARFVVVVAAAWLPLPAPLPLPFAPEEFPPDASAASRRAEALTSTSGRQLPWRPPHLRLHLYLAALALDKTRAPIAAKGATPPQEGPASVDGGSWKVLAFVSRGDGGGGRRRMAARRRSFAVPPWPPGR